MRPVVLLSLVGVFIGAIALGGCTGDLFEIIPKIKDASAGQLDFSLVDLGPAFFIPNIQADLDNTDNALGPNATTCASSSACHQSPDSPNAPLLIQMPTSDADKMSNYNNFMGECDSTNPEQSPVLQNPGTANSGHTGGTLFTSADPIYQRWVSWIANGEPYQ